MHRKQRRENNYKEYSEETLQRLMTIQRIKKFGFTLNETLDLLGLMDTNRAFCLSTEKLKRWCSSNNK